MLTALPYTGWTKLTASAGPARFTAKRAEPVEIWLIFSASTPDDNDRTPGASDESMLLDGESPALSTDQLSGTSLDVYGRPVADVATSIITSEVI